jgi:hypothetical protein
MFGDWIPGLTNCGKSRHGRAKNSAAFARTHVTTYSPLLQERNHPV